MLPQSIGKETNIKLPFSFISFSLIALVASQVLLLTNSEAMVNHTFRIPSILAAAHLFVLGWALMVAMGAMYQLVPVAFLTPIWSEKFGFIQFAVTALGIGSFAISLHVSPANSLIPGILALLGILMFLFQMFMTLRKQAKPNILTLFVGSALFCLLATITLGILLVISMKTGFLSGGYSILFKSHLLLGTVGWFSLLIFGFSYKMVPMFSLAHGYSMKPAKWIYLIYALGILTMLMSFFTKHSGILTLGLGALSVGYLYFARHISTIVKGRVKKKLDRPFQFALLGIICGGLLHVSAFLAALFNSFELLVGLLLFLYLLTWIGFSIIGYLYKIVPFLWWTHKYSKEIGKRQVPSLKDMMNERAALPLFISLIASAMILAVSLSIGSQALFFTGQLLLTLSTIAFSVVVVLVTRK